MNQITLDGKGPLVSQAVFARLMGVSKSTVTRWVASGRMALVNSKVDVHRARMQLEATASPMPHHQARKAQLDESREAGQTRASQQTDSAASDASEWVGGDQGSDGERKAADVETGDDVGVMQASASLKATTERLQRIKADIAQVELMERTRQLMPVSEVNQAVRAFAQGVAAQLDQVADRMAATLAGLGGDTAAIHAELDAAMESIKHEVSRQMGKLAEAEQ